MYVFRGFGVFPGFGFPSGIWGFWVFSLAFFVGFLGVLRYVIGWALDFLGFAFFRVVLMRGFCDGTWVLGCFVEFRRWF